jgi:hypothetical protein
MMFEQGDFSTQFDTTEISEDKKLSLVCEIDTETLHSPGVVG